MDDTFLDDTDWDIEMPERNGAMMAHIFALVFFFIPVGNLLVTGIYWFAQKDKKDFVRQHAAAAANFQFIALAFALTGYLLFQYVDFSMAFIVMFGAIGMNIYSCIAGAIKAKEGQKYRYPIDIIKIYK